MRSSRFRSFVLQADVGDVLLGKALDLSAGERMRSGEAEESADLIERESELTAASDEGQPL